MAANRPDRAHVPGPLTWRGVAGLAATGNALHPASTTGDLAGPAFLVGLPVSEFPLLTLGLQVASTAAGLRGGRWRTRDGAFSVAAQALSAAGLVRLQQGALQSSRVLEAALTEGLGPSYRDVVEAAGLAPAVGPAVRPMGVVPSWIRRRSFVTNPGIQYGPARRRNLLDIWRRRDLPPGGSAPVLIQVPGGGWVSGGRRSQAYPLMARLVDGGWVCVPINYRLSPRATFPDHIIDVKRAIAWVKEHIAEFGGDPNFIAITGGSAGGHLSSLAALTGNEPGFQPGFEHADTTVQAAVPLYGIYDLADWNGKGGPIHSIRFVEKYVLKVDPAAEPEPWRRASPMSWARPDAPPMMLIHGTNDSLAPIEGARLMAARLRAVSRQPVVFAELPFAQHAFDVAASVRTRYTVRAIEQFLAFVRAGCRDLAGAADRAGPLRARG
jgi:acetyl esterase/lipase